MIDDFNTHIVFISSRRLTQLAG